MPTYDYQAVNIEKGCVRCREGFEAFESIHDDPQTDCPECGSAIHRVITRIHINTRSTSKTLMKDSNLKKHGFKKLQRGDDGQYRDVLDRGSGADRDGKLPDLPASWD